MPNKPLSFSLSGAEPSLSPSLSTLLTASLGPARQISRCRPLLGTYVEIRLPAVDAAAVVAAEAAIDDAFDTIALCGQLMSFHDPLSELSRINCAPDGQLIDVHPWTAQVLANAMDLFELTEGVFDAGVASELVGWGLLPAMSMAPAGKRTSLADLEIVTAHQVRVHRTTCIDLGGIAKGFAVDRATDALTRHGVTCAIVNAGGDLRVLGEAAQDVHVRHPASPSTLVHLGQLADAALATSAPYFSRQLTHHEGAKYAEVCALINAHTREPVLDVHSYMIIAPECWVADALTKVLAAGVDPHATCFLRYGAQAVVI